MRVLHVDTATEFRGGQRQLELLVAGLARRGVEQRVACPPGVPLRTVLGDVELVDVRPGNHPANLVTLRTASSDVDLVAAHTSHAHFAGLGVRAPLVVHRRVDFPPKAGWLSARKYDAPAGFICVSQAVAGVLEAAGVPTDRLHVVPDGVEPQAQMPPSQVGEGRVVLAVGALVDHKDHATLAAAAHMIEARVLVAGEGPLRSPLEDGPLELLGRRDDVAGLLARADVFVHCSQEEGMGQAVVEAMLAGVPVVATRAGGVPEVVGDAGLLVPVRDPRALAEAVDRALRGEHPPVERARARAARFSVDAMVEGTLAAYRAAL